MLYHDDGESCYHGFDPGDSQSLRPLVMAGTATMGKALLGRGYGTSSRGQEGRMPLSGGALIRNNLNTVFGPGCRERC